MTTETPTKPPVPAPQKGKFRENVESAGTAILLFLIVRTFFFQAFRIPSESMEDTFLKGDFLFVNKMLYGAKVPFSDFRLPGIRGVERGDVVVFKFPVDRKTDYIKRCVAVAGDSLRVDNNNLYVNGELVDEPYARFKGTANSKYASWPPQGGQYVVPNGHYFAMGDNRNNSQDSRFFAEKGAPEYAVPEELLVGKAMFIYYSADPWYNVIGVRLGRMFRAVR
jgi:signal peptidase I